MAVKAPVRERIREEQEVWVSDHALTFDEYLSEYEGYREHIELHRGVPKTRMAANIRHEALFMWIARLLGDYVERHDLGFVFGSRRAVKITNYDGRLPDILFVRKERKEILQWMQLSASPDLVIEIISPGDRRSDKLELEADYKSIGVPEIVFVDMDRRTVQLFQKVNAHYHIELAESGTLRLKSVSEFWLDIDWLFNEDRPPVHEALAAIASSK
jgi:Uma2 family endonuclease